MTQSTSPWIEALHPQVSDDGAAALQARGQITVSGPGKPSVNDDPTANGGKGATVLTFPAPEIVTKQIDAASGPITQGYGVMPKDGKVTLAIESALPLAVLITGIALEAGVAGASISVETQGLVDPAVFNVGAGEVTAVGLDVNGKPVRITDATCVSGAQYLGTCDANGAIYVNPQRVHTTSTVDAGATGDGTTNDHAAVLGALTAAALTGGEALIPSGDSTGSTATVTLTGKSVAIRGKHRRASAIKALTTSMTLLDLSGAPGMVLTLENLTIDANAKAFLLVAGGTLFDSIEIRQCDFPNMSAEAAALSFGNLSNLEIDGCLFDGNGGMVSTALAVSAPIRTLKFTNNRLRGLNTGVSLSSGTVSPAIQDITIEGNYFDMMYYTAPSLDGNSGGTVTYTSNTLTDTARTFVLGAFGTIGTFNQFSYIRALPVRHTATVTGASRSQLVDSAAHFLSDGIIAGEIIRVGTASGIIVSVEDDTHINIEEWLDQTTTQPTATPTNGATYTVFGVILSKASTASSHVINLLVVWADLNGTPTTPANGTRWEYMCTPNYPVTTSASVRRARIIGNTVLRSATDGLSPFGDECEIAGNVIRDGQDVGITIDGIFGVSGLKGGRHNVHDNLIIRAGSEGIYFGGEFAPCIHHNRIFGWGARTSGFSSPGAGESGIDLNPGGVTSITGGVCDHNVIDGDGLPNAYYGITCLDLIGVDVDTNNIRNVIKADYNIEGDNTDDVTLRHRNASIDYTTSGGRGIAPGVKSTLYGTGAPLGVVTAGIGSTYFDTTLGLLWVKVSGTDATGWQYLSPTEFAPGSIPTGLQLWVRADRGVSLSGSDVTAWADQSGAGDANRNYTASATHYPTFVAADSDFNNKAAFTFDPSTLPQYLVSGTWSTPLPGVCTWFAMVKLRVSGLAVVTEGITAGHVHRIIANSGSFGEFSEGGDCIGDKNMYQGTRCVIAVANGAPSRMHINEVAGVAGGDPGTVTMTGSILGVLNDLTSFPLDGKIAEIAAWDRNLTAGEIASLHAYATARYGVGIDP